MELENNNYCFICGKDNPCGLRLSFHSAHGKTTSEFVPSRSHQGYKNIVHGGIIASVLDEAMIQAALSEGMFPVTAEINVRYKKPLTVERKTIVEAEITRQGHRLIEAHARLLDSGSNEIIAEAHAKLIK